MTVLGETVLRETKVEKERERARERECMCLWQRLSGYWNRVAKLGAKHFSCGVKPFKKPWLLFSAWFQLFLGYTPVNKQDLCVCVCIRVCTCMCVCLCVYVCMCMSLNNTSRFLFVWVLVLLLFKWCIMHNVFALALWKCTVWVCVPMWLSYACWVSHCWTQNCLKPAIWAVK